MTITPIPKPTRAERKKTPADTSALPFPKAHFDRDAKFKAFVNAHACLLSGFANHDCGGVTEFSHLLTGGTSVKCSDYHAVPLCSNHHRLAPGSFHHLGSWESFESVHGINLWRENAALLAEWVRRMR